MFFCYDYIAQFSITPQQSTAHLAQNQIIWLIAIMYNWLIFSPNLK